MMVLTREASDCTRLCFCCDSGKARARARAVLSSVTRVTCASAQWLHEAMAASNTRANAAQSLSPATESVPGSRESRMNAKTLQSSATSSDCLALNVCCVMSCTQPEYERTSSASRRKIFDLSSNGLFFFLSSSSITSLYFSSELVPVNFVSSVV